MIFWVDLEPGKRFQNPAMSAIDFSNRNSIKFLRKFGRKIAKIHFFSHPVCFCLQTYVNYLIKLILQRILRSKAHYDQRINNFLRFLKYLHKALIDTKSAS